MNLAAEFRPCMEYLYLVGLQPALMLYDTSILIVDNYVTIPVSPRSRYTTVYHCGTKYRETAKVSRVSSIPCSSYYYYHY